MKRFRSSLRGSILGQTLVYVTLAVVLSACVALQEGTANAVLQTTKSASPVVVDGPTALATTSPPATLSSTVTPMPQTGVVTQEPTGTLVTMGALLVQVSEQGNGRPRQEVWLLDPGHTVPRSLLASDNHSFEHPIWSHNGEWISYRQRDLDSNQYQVGIVRRDGTEQHLVSDKIFVKLSPPLWSWDDNWLISTTDDSIGNFGIMMEVETGNSQILNLDGSTHYTRLMVLPSPSDERVLFAAQTSNGSEEILKMGIITTGKPDAYVPIKVERWPDCKWFTALDWSPDGQFLLVQPGNDVQQPSCPPSIWSYTFQTQTWSQVVTPPSKEPHYLYLTWIEWSPDGRWILWKEIDRILVLDSVSWNVVRMIALDANQKWLTQSFIENATGNSYIAIAEFDYGQPPKWYNLVALRPNGTNQNDRVVAQILREPDWLPIGSDYIPISWEPRPRVLPN